MATEKSVLEIKARDERGKAAVRLLRSEGFVPGVLYSHDMAENVVFKVSAKELQKAIDSAELVHKINVDGQELQVLFKEVQYHPVLDDIVHVDFQGVKMDEMIHVSVPVHLEGKPVGVRDEGGQLHHGVMDIEIRCKASDVPSHFEVNVEELNIGDAIHVGDIAIGDVELLSSPEALVASVLRPKTEEELAAELGEVEEEFEFEEEEGEGEAAEGEETEGSDEPAEE